MPVKTFPITLENAELITPNVKHFKFRCELTPTFDFKPGQFITIHFEKDGKMLRRSYSIANVPQQNNIIEFAAGFVEGGPASELLFNLQPGETLQANGPFGRLILKEEVPKRYVLVATSTGITPYRSMMPELKNRLEQDKDLEVVILQGVQKREDVLYLQELRDFAETMPSVTFQAHLSRESDDNLAAHEKTGYVQTAFDSLNLNPENDVVYLCGNPGMIDESFNVLKDKGFELKSIIREKYISAK